MKQKIKKITDTSLKIYSYLISIIITFQFFFNIKPIFIPEEIIICILVISLIIAFFKNFRKLEIFVLFPIQWINLHNIFPKNYNFLEK